jgi:uncharacterized protein
MERSIDSGSSTAKRFFVDLSFYGDLGFFVKDKVRLQPIRRVLTHKRSVKDVIESIGVPHPEIDLIHVNGQPVDFSFHLEADTAVHVFPVSPNLFPTFPLQERGVHSFVADCHLGKLARDLRLLGIDVVYHRDANDRDLLDTMLRESRALLTRDRPLLMHRTVRTGYFPRSQDPMEQTTEVIRRFGLARAIAPFVRCLRCNGLLAAVSKETVLDQLKPLTRLYYDEFQRCPRCGHCYWRGSHVAKLERRVETILNQIAG